MPLILAFSTDDLLMQDLLWEYAQRCREKGNVSRATEIEEGLKASGFTPDIDPALSFLEGLRKIRTPLINIHREPCDRFEPQDKKKLGSPCRTCHLPGVQHKRPFRV